MVAPGPAAMSPGAAHPLSNGVTDGPCFLMGGPTHWKFDLVLAAAQLAQHRLSQVMHPPLCSSGVSWQMIYPAALGAGSCTPDRRI